jgi:demethylmenaquinone methyltransferase / 2-methoxy-6-polyprenyl-1,4-benzoquinol methylase
MRAALDPAHVESVYDDAAHRYDLYHGVTTLGSDQRGRRLVVEWGVRAGDRVLDAGGGTGSTALLAAKRVGETGQVTVLDQSEGMMTAGRVRAREAGLEDRISFRTGDILALPFPDASFEAVLSTYSLCPVYDPALGARELYRVLKPGGRLACAHSAEPQGRLTRLTAHLVEGVLWKLPSLSLGCRAIEVLPALEMAGARMVRSCRLGVPLWPFFVFVVEKPE